MAARVSKKMKLAILVLIGLISSSLLYAYYKIFGGDAQKLSRNQFIVGNNTPTTSPSETKHTTSPTPLPAKEQIVAVTYSPNPAQGVRQVIHQTGNLDFIQPGQKVLIKPNVNSDDPAPATTDPESLAEVVRLAKQKGAYVIVADRSNPRWKTIAAMKKTGMHEAAQAAGADEIVGFENEDWIRVSPENATHWPKGFRIPQRLEEIDHIISVPVLHTHSITGHSLAIKNLVGLIHPTDRMLFHASSNIEAMIAEISLAIKPSLTVIEGNQAFIDGGPSHGTLADTQVYLASKDTLVADVVGATLLQKHGAQLSGSSLWDSPQIKHFLNLNLSPFTQQEIQKQASTQI